MGNLILFCCASIITRRVIKEKFEINKSRNVDFRSGVYINQDYFCNILLFSSVM